MSPVSLATLYTCAYRYLYTADNSVLLWLSTQSHYVYNKIIILDFPLFSLSEFKISS